MEVGTREKSKKRNISVQGQQLAGSRGRIWIKMERRGEIGMEQNEYWINIELGKSGEGVGRMKETGKDGEGRLRIKGLGKVGEGRVRMELTGKDR